MTDTEWRKIQGRRIVAVNHYDTTVALKFDNETVLNIYYDEKDKKPYFYVKDSRDDWQFVYDNEDTDD